MPSLAIPPMGHYAIALAASVESLRVTPWTMASSTAETLALGAAVSPDSACLPFKATMGHFVKAALEGVEYGVMVNSVGTCRLHYYRAVQQKLLEERGINMRLFGLGYDGVKPPLIRHFDPDLGPFLRSAVRAALKIAAVDRIEKHAWRTRPLERTPGETTRAMNECLADLARSRTAPEIRAVNRAVAPRFARIAVDPSRRPLRVALVGETTVLRDRFLNHNMEEVLGGLGVETRNFFLLGAELRNIFNVGLWSRNSRWALKRVARPYLDSLVGGHALDSVAHTLRCAREAYDGVVHLAPTGCMPEVSIRPILRRVSRDTGLPVLEFSFDEHTSHVGVTTRLEAFVDVLLAARKRREQ
jgi:predicted nucleotide-binding protein (sugar kinase/HSP70/actin superfamily)